MGDKVTARNRPALRSVESLRKALVALSHLIQFLERSFEIASLQGLYDPAEVNEDNFSASLKECKGFSVGLLEDPVRHPWWPSIRRLQAHDRTSIAGSLFLWRKCLPASPPSVSEFISRVTGPACDLPPGYLGHVRKIVREAFPRGWDRSYLGHVDVAVPTTSSVKECGKGRGGYRAMGPDRMEYAIACTDPDLDFRIDNRLKYMNAVCDGKVRSVTIMGASAQVLKPLHKTIYENLSRQKWLLRGAARPCRFKEFKRKVGEVFVSGDYESASDHLPLEVAEEALFTMFRSSQYIPGAVKAGALRLLHASVDVDGRTVKVTRQLMGSLLCFPLLCLQNYIAFRWIFPSTTPVRVNGDDIVFRSTRSDYERWAAFVARVGLKLSPGKTLVSSSQFSLNSTFFLSRRRRVPSLIPVVRSVSLVRPCTPGSLPGAWRNLSAGWRGRKLDLLASWFLRARRRVIQKSGRSVVRGLRVLVSEWALKDSGLWPRELFLLSVAPNLLRSIGGVPSEIPLPPEPTSLVHQVGVPPGWVRVPREEALLKVGPDELEEKQKEFFECLVDASWSRPPPPRGSGDREYWGEVASGGFEAAWTRWKTQGKFRGKMKRLFRGFSAQSRLRAAPFFRLRRSDWKKKDMVWVFEGDPPNDLPLSTDEVKERFLHLVQESIVIDRLVRDGQSYLVHEKWLAQEDLLDSAYVL